MQQTSAKGVQDEARLGGKGNPLGIVQETEILSYYHIVYAQSRIHLREGDA